MPVRMTNSFFLYLRHFELRRNWTLYIFIRKFGPRKRLISNIYDRLFIALFGLTITNSRNDLHFVTAALNQGSG